MKKNFLLSFILATFCLPIFANNITVSAPTLTDGSPSDGGSGYGYVNFDLSWENSWRLSSGASNWDAAWVFVKYRVGGTGEWLPANLHNTGHIAGSGTAADITVGLVDDNSAFDATTNPGIGVYVYRSTVGSSTFSNRGLKLRWDYGADGVVGGANVELRVFAIEMVRVMEGAFNVGGGGGNYAFESTTISTANATTAPTGVGALGGASGGYPTGITAPANASWPNGYAAFYCMKYEVTQQQYVDFLNTLTQTQADAHKYTEAAYRYAITGSVVGNYATTLPNVACSLISTTDGAAYADWSGLRPMTELEFEKACRGNQPAVAGEYAWGTAGIANLEYTLSNAGAANEGIATNYSVTVGNSSNVNTSYTGPVRVGIFAANGSNTGRVSAGASYWGIMELSGNLNERTISIGIANNRLFTGATGDGLLESNGNPNIANCYFSGWRGGSYENSPEYLYVSGRDNAVNTNNGISFNIGFRAVRR